MTFEPLDRLSRRGFFKLAGIGLAACSSRPAREILPYANQAPEMVPGVPLYFATALVEDGFATGVIVESHEGRPTKIEGNPDHPASLGATRAIEQAAVLSLYDPERARMITDRGMPTTWAAIASWLTVARERERVHVLAEPTSSPIEIELIERARAAGVAFTFWSPFALRCSLEGNRIAFGRPLQTQLDLRAADVIVTLDADLVAEHPMALSYARQIADRRRVRDAESKMSRIYAIEAAYTPTGVIADHRLRVRPSSIAGIARQLLAAIEGKSTETSGMPQVSAIARDLARAGRRGVVVAGELQPPTVHALVAMINARLESAVVAYTEPVAYNAGGDSRDLSALAHALSRGEVESLIVLGGDPVFTAELPVGRAATSLYVGLYDNATAQACRFVAPGLHDLECWGTTRAYDGTLAPQQPLIEPLFAGRSRAAVLHELLGDPPADERVRTAAAWQRLVPGVPFEPALARGVVEGTAAPRVPVTLTGNVPPEVHSVVGLELQVRPSPFLHDGRYATNPWLLELPDPITKLTWDNAAQVSPATAYRSNLETGDIVTLASNGHTLAVPAIVVPGHADDVVSLYAGFGTHGVGVNAFHLVAGAVTLRSSGERRELAVTQGQLTQHGRPIALGGKLAQLHDPAFRDELAHERSVQPTIIAGFPQRGPQWAMSIDLTTCTGCTACVMACSAENNVPVVGRERVLNSREMHWLRIDRYVQVDDISVQPMACQHCEKAPCEYVCPVEATTHSPDGLNEMTYNRCVGTRFCSNNCPYKVRRFNWFDFKDHAPLRVLGKNPEVTIRDRGVMEKCTYCVQRIRRAEIDARIANRAIGEVRTACQQACPTEAISFGSLTEPGSTVAEHRTRPHSYAVLNDQGTVPRTRYLARIRNPNPEMP